jgi:hypothetical protein
VKKWICIILIFFAAGPAHSQWITGLSVNPSTPTTIDNIQVIVEAMLPSAGCSEWYIMGQSQTGFEYTYTIVNCVGLLTVICSHYDTINVGGPLPAGNYTVIVNLNAGSGNKPCSPFSQWVSDTVYFNVSTYTGLPAMNNNLPFTCYPDPATDYLTIEMPGLTGETLLSFYNLQGQLLVKQVIHQVKEKINISRFSGGVFIIKASNNNDISVKKFVKE